MFKYPQKKELASEGDELTSYRRYYTTFKDFGEERRIWKRSIDEWTLEGFTNTDIEELELTLSHFKEIHRTRLKQRLPRLEKYSMPLFSADEPQIKFKKKLKLIEILYLDKVKLLPLHFAAFGILCVIMVVTYLIIIGLVLEKEVLSINYAIILLVISMSYWATIIMARYDFGSK